MKMDLYYFFIRHINRVTFVYLMSLKDHYTYYIILLDTLKLYYISHTNANKLVYHFIKNKGCPICS